MAELSQATQKFIQRYQSWHQSLQPGETATVIQVDEVASRVAAFYEKMRGVVDWREEHLMRRAAIERNLKRRLFLLKNGENIAEPLVFELIRAGHFPNGRIPESKIEIVRKALNKYIFILKNSPPPQKEKKRIQLFDWVLGISASEIEEILSPPLKEKAQIEYMEAFIKERLIVKKGIEISEEEKNIQLYIAVQKALLKLDPSTITYNLLKRRFNDWEDFTEENAQIQEITTNIYSIWENFEKDFNHPLADKFYRIAEKYNTPYLLIGDVVSEEPMLVQEKIKNPENLESLIGSAYQKRERTLKTRTKRAAIYVTLSIFISKILLALAIEIPFDKYFTGQFGYSALTFNILIPPLLMFFLVLTIRSPKKENLQRVIMEVMKIVYNKEKREIYTIEPRLKRSWLMNVVVTLFYLLTFFISFGLIIFGLNNLNFGVISIIIFLIFISLISFAGVKLRERSRELEVIESKESVLRAFIDLFSLPVIRVGKWLSRQWSRYNVIVVIINFLIDMPFQIFIEFLEQWRAFLKEKKEEIH